MYLRSSNHSARDSSFATHCSLQHKCGFAVSAMTLTLPTRKDLALFSNSRRVPPSSPLPTQLLGGVGAFIARVQQKSSLARLLIRFLKKMMYILTFLTC